jgi:hypothetical protein
MKGRRADGRRASPLERSEGYSTSILVATFLPSRSS